MQSILERSRGEKRITLREMSEKTGIHFTKISRQERRREPLYPRDIQRYANFFGIEPREIADKDGFARVAE
jgi:transcriptional regulator with XRE-family HTH domain